MSPEIIQMAHDIATINGKSAVFTAVKPAWHNLGITVPNTINWAEAMNHAQLNWQVVKKDVFVRRPVQGDVFQLPDIKAVHRDNDGAYLGTVGKGYELIQNEEMFRYVDDLLQAINGAHYESAGALGNGSLVWCMARLPQDSIIRGTTDRTQNYLLFTGSHDGSTRNIAKLVRERVVCANTRAIALGEEGKELSFKHTKNVRIKMDEAKSIWLGIQKDVAEQDALENTLASRLLTKESFIAVLNRLFPANDEAKHQTKREGILTNIAQLYQDNDGGKIPEVAGTAWALLNAVTRYSDHFRPVRLTQGRQGLTETEVRSQNAMFGTGDSLKSEAMVAVLEETASNPTKGQTRDSVVPFRFKSDSDFLGALGIKG